MADERIEIEELPSTSIPSLDHRVAAMLGGLTVYLTVAQIVEFAKDKLAGWFHAASGKTALADADEFGIVDTAASNGLKKVTLTNLISSIFKTARKIANAVFDPASFRLQNAGGFSPIFSVAGLTADRTWNIPNSDISFPFTKEFISAPQTITTAGLLTLAHGLGVAPKLVMPVLICTTAENGYSAGDIIPANPSVATAANNDFGTAFEISGTTNIIVRFGAAAQAFLGNHKTTGALVAMTNANWRLTMRAWA